MKITTRSQTLKTVKARALRDLVLEFISFHDLKAITLFTQKARYSPEVATAVVFAAVKVKERSEQGGLATSTSPVPAIRRALTLIINVTDLEIIVPFKVPSSMFNGVRLPQLVTFKTNIKHRAIGSFLAQNPTIVHLLLLASCGSATSCSLAATELPALTELKCGYACLPNSLPSSLSHLELFDPIPHTAANSAIFTTRKCFPLKYLTVVALEVLEDEYDVLQNVHEGAPNVGRLKLVEKPVSSYRRGSSLRRAWNEPVSWGADLRKLHLLREIRLRTTSPLIPRPGELHSEGKLLRSWFARRSRDTESSMVTHVVLWYSCLGRGSEAFSEWRGRDDEWQRIFSTPTPESDDVMF